MGGFYCSKVFRLHMYLDSLSDENPPKTKKTFPCIRFVYKAIDERPELPSLELGQVTMTPVLRCGCKHHGPGHKHLGTGSQMLPWAEPSTLLSHKSPLI